MHGTPQLNTQKAKHENKQQLQIKNKLNNNNNNNNNVHLYTPHFTWFQGGLQFCKGEIGRQHIEGASGCRFSPYVISPHPPRPRPDHNTGNPVPYPLRTVSGNKGCDTRPTVYRPYPED